MYGGPVGLYASAHLAASLEPAPWVEMDSKPNPLFERILQAEPRIEAGELVLPPGPGIGNVFDENVLRAADVTEL
jgi:L-alanine-DL-glutamate epimerase-like enolase superfamily enzyme